MLLQAPQAGYGSGYDNSSYSSAGAGGAYQSAAAYQSAPQAAPVPQFAPQSRTAMPAGSASYASQMGGGPAQQAPAYAPQPSRVRGLDTSLLRWPLRTMMLTGTAAYFYECSVYRSTPTASWQLTLHDEYEKRERCAFEMLG